MVRENLRKAITQSGLVVKEIADKSGVKKTTIDNWIGNRPTTPRVNDLVSVARVLGVSAEWIVTGERSINWYPDRIKDIVEDLKLLDSDDELDAVRTLAHHYAERRRAQSEEAEGG